MKIVPSSAQGCAFRRESGLRRKIVIATPKKVMTGPFLMVLEMKHPKMLAYCLKLKDVRRFGKRPLCSLF